MKLINYNYGYYHKFDCVFHGKIIMSADEFQTVRRFLLQGQKRWLPSYPWVARQILEDEKIQLKTKNGYYINLRVPATETIVKKYNLSNYKRGNYFIHII